MYLIIKNNIVTVKISVIPLARMIGKSLIKIPYKNHKEIPVVNTAYIPNDKSLVCLVRMVFIACGKNEMVVQVAATNPSKVINFILVRLLRIHLYILSSRLEHYCVERFWIYDAPKERSRTAEASNESLARIGQNGAERHFGQLLINQLLVFWLQIR